MIFIRNTLSMPELQVSVYQVPPAPEPKRRQNPQDPAARRRNSGRNPGIGNHGVGKPSFRRPH